MDSRSLTEGQKEQRFGGGTCLAKMSGVVQAKTVDIKGERQMFKGRERAQCNWDHEREHKFTHSRKLDGWGK